MKRKDASIVQPAETFDALRHRVRDRFPTLSPHLQRIARASLEEPNNFALNTTQVIADELQIQPSTLIRFAKEFGFSGFAEMQRVFRQRLIEGEATVRERVLANSSAATPSDLEAVFDESLRAHVLAIETMRKACNFDDLAAATEMLRNARHVYVAGLRRSKPLADYLAYGLLRGERAASLIEFASGMAGPQIATFGAEDLLVAIAFPPYTQAVVDAVMDAHVSGRRVLTITDKPESPLAQFCDLALHVPTSADSQFQPIAGAIALIHALLIATAHPG